MQQQGATLITLARVDWLDPRAAALRDEMNLEMDALYATLMTDRDPETMRIFAAALAVDPPEIVGTVLALEGDHAVGQAALRPRGDALEVKKVVVDPSQRGRGISRMLMAELEVIARELGYSRLILQTGNRQTAAVALYEAIGYTLTAPYAPYEIISSALCYEKLLGGEPSFESD